MPLGFRPTRAKPLIAGILTSLLAASLIYFLPASVLERPRELFFDALTQSVSSPESDHVVVVDIDRTSSQAAPNEEWQRPQTAALIAAIANAGPAAIALDFVFSNECDPSDPANKALGDAIGKVPSVLGFLIGDQIDQPPRPVPTLAVQRPVGIPDAWFIEGTESSCAMLQDRSAAAAGAFLVGDDDALVRKVQAYSIVGSAAYPALGLEVARLSAGAKTPVLGGTPAYIRQDARVLWPDENGNLRFVAADANRIARRTVSAIDVIHGQVASERIRGRVILIGSSQPALGGLRASASMPLEPSVQIHADLANAVLTDFVPTRSLRLVPWEAGVTLLAGIATAFASTRLRPIYAAVFGVAAIVATIGLAALVYRQAALLIDAVSIVVSIVAVLLVSGVLQFAHVKRAAQTARQRFSQYLPQSVVARYIDNPHLERIAGEERQVTAVFTDIEGFTALSHRIGPQRLVPLLDIYFREVNALVESRGGMIDKIVGDAVNALFNAPEDLEGHVDKAIDCAIEIHALTEDIRRRPEFMAEGFGRTRIGIETGIAIFGEVGSGGRLDYTAHGEVMNAAARLQEANKEFGTAICIGPAAAAETTRPMRSLGKYEIRGIGVMELFTPSESEHG